MQKITSFSGFNSKPIRGEFNLVNYKTLQFLFEFFNYPVFVFDGKQRIDFVSENTLKLFPKISRPEFLNDIKISLLHDGKKISFDKIQKELEVKNAWSGELNLLYRQEIDKKLEATLTAITIGGKVLTVVFLTGKCKEEIITSFLNVFVLLDRLADAVPYGCFLYSAKSKKYLFLNKYLKGQLERISETSIDDTDFFINYSDKATSKKLNAAVRKLKNDAGNGCEVFDIDFLCKNNSWKKIKTTISTLKLEAGHKSEIFIGFMLDESERMHTEFLLKQNTANYLSLLNSSSDLIFVLNKRKIEFANKAWFDVFGYSEKEVFEERFDFMQVIAPAFRPKMFDLLDRIGKKQFDLQEIELQCIAKDGNSLDVKAEFEMIEWHGHKLCRVRFSDLTELNICKKSHSICDKLLDGVSNALKLLNTQLNLAQGIQSAIKIIASATDANRVYIFENYDNSATSEHFMTLSYEWTTETPAVSKNIKERQKISYKKLPGWYGKLSTGTIINEIGNNSPYIAAVSIDQTKHQSTLVIPIFIENKFWGFIGFDKFSSEKIWSEIEVDALCAFGNSIGNSVARQQAKVALFESEEKYKLLFDQAADIIIMLDTKNRIVDVNNNVELEINWKQHELLDRNILYSGLFTNESSHILLKAIEEKNKDSVYEIDLIKKNGIIIPFEMYVVPLYKEDRIVNIQAIFRNIKDRKESEKNLRESEEKYRDIFENVQDIFFQTDLHGKIITISPSIERYSGYKPEELVGKKVISFYATPKERAKLLREMQEKTEVIDFIVRLRHRENKIVYVSVNSHTLKNKYGEIVGIEGSLRDVTERELAYEEIRKLSRAVEQSPSTVVITDTSGKIVYINPKFTETTGYSSQEVIGKNPNILKSGEMKIEQYKELWDTITSGKEWKGEFHNKRKDGSLYWEKASISPVKNENGEITHFLGIKEDITEKKSREKELLRYQNLLKGVSESVQILISEKDFDAAVSNALEALGKGSDADRVYIFENSKRVNRNVPMMELKYEWHDNSVQGIADTQLMNGFNTGYYKSAFQNTLNKNKSFSVLTKHLPETDQIILKHYGTLSMLIIPIYVDKMFWGFIGFDNCHCEDAWSESEEAILNATAATIGRAIEREKTNMELIRAKEEAEKAERLKSEFLAQISHEIRSPLNVLLNYSQLFKEIIGDKIDPEIFQGFDGMENAGNRIIRTIDLLLNISEIQAGSYSYRPAEFDIYTTVIMPLFKEYKKLARGKNIIFNLVRHTDDTKIVGDEYSLVQIFANLIDNAIKYTNEGNIEIYIDRNFNGKLFVKVSDSGIGISENYLPKIFSPFTQEEQGYTRSYEGNGLGLALVKKYCELNNAEIFVDSAKGKGTSFTIIFND